MKLQRALLTRWGRICRQPRYSYRGSDIGNGNQIGDFEPHYYRYTEPDTAVVQPLWSQQARAFVVEDGTTVNFYLSPLWAHSKQGWSLQAGTT